MNWKQDFEQLDRGDVVLKINIGERRRDGRYPIQTVFPTGRIVTSLAPNFCAAMDIKEKHEGGLKLCR